jgi:hypothetical protein
VSVRRGCGRGRRQKGHGACGAPAVPAASLPAERSQGGGDGGGLEVLEWRSGQTEDEESEWV